MIDQCRHCILRGSVEKCETFQKAGGCQQYGKSWYVQEIIKQRDGLIEAAKEAFDQLALHHKISGYFSPKLASDWAIMERLRAALTKAGIKNVDLEKVPT